MRIGKTNRIQKMFTAGVLFIIMLFSVSTVFGAGEITIQDINYACGATAVGGPREGDMTVTVSVKNNLASTAKLALVSVLYEAETQALRNANISETYNVAAGATANMSVVLYAETFDGMEVQNYIWNVDTMQTYVAPVKHGLIANAAKTGAKTISIIWDKAMDIEGVYRYYWYDNGTQKSSTTSLTRGGATIANPSEGTHYIQVKGVDKSGSVVTVSNVVVVEFSADSEISTDAAFNNAASRTIGSPRTNPYMITMGDTTTRWDGSVGSLYSGSVSTGQPITSVKKNDYVLISPEYNKK